MHGPACSPQPGDDDLEVLLEQRGVDFVEYAGWQTIDEAERAAGEPTGRPRVKLHAWDDLLETGRRVQSRS